jgi:hypothetical protein
MLHHALTTRGAARGHDGWRWIVCLWVGLCLLAGVAHAQDTAPPPTGQSAPPLVSSDIPRMIEMGQHLVWQNNPALAPPGVKPDTSLSHAARNDAAAQAQRIFRAVVTRVPQNAQGWLWLGITLSQTLQYDKEHPKGQRVLTDAVLTEALDAYRTAYERAATDMVFVGYYGDALMELRRDFDTARKLWDSFLPVAKDDVQRVTALTQAGRACLNKAYFGKTGNTLTAEQAAAVYKEAQAYVNRAAQLVPKAECVRTMQGLLQQYRKYFMGK